VRLRRILGIAFVIASCWGIWMKYSSTSSSVVSASTPTGAREPQIVSSRDARQTTPTTDVQAKPPRLTQKPKRVSPERRAELLSAFLRAKAKPELQQEEEAPRAAAGETKLTTKQYIQEQLDGIQPMIAECFYAAKKADPSLRSDLPVAFTIGGEPGVGGLVTEAELHPSLAAHKGLTDCVQETLFSLEIDPPRRGSDGQPGEVGVRYSFEFDEEGE